MNLNDTITISSGTNINDTYDTMASSSIYSSLSDTFVFNPGTIASPSTVTVPNTVTITDGTTLGSIFSVDPYYNTSAMQNGGLIVSGDAEVAGKLKVGGQDIIETLEKIQEHLAILKPSPELEQRWDELRELRNAYEKLKQDILEKEKLYEILAK